MPDAQWSPEQYLKFADQRLRPATELLARIPLSDPKLVVDLGCGAGNVTRILAERWPTARILGVDASADMLAAAAGGLNASSARIDWHCADLADWQPPAAPDLIYSNAALHWLAGHERLFTRLFNALRPGGLLAVQMPRNFAEPSHRAILETIEDGPWRPRLRPLWREKPVEEPATYYRLLSSLGARVDIWETIYWQLLDGPDPVVEWTKGTWLRPFLAALEKPERSAFEADYRGRIAGAYPPEPDGRTLFPFRRLFLLAWR